MIKKVLIITYYWPPSGGNGVQRWVKFVKYLREFGWEPVIYTVKKGEFPVLDFSLEKEIPENIEVIKTKIWEPYSFYKKFTGKKKNSKVNRDTLSADRKKSFAENLAVWIRGNLFIPDARCFWITPSIKFLQNYLVNNSIDVIVSTGPPHSTHLIANGVKKKTGIKWLADFRDPWTTMDFYKDLMLTKKSDSKHHKFEKEVLVNADAVVTVGKLMQQEFEQKRLAPVELITNGFDEIDFEKYKNVSLDKKFSIAHIGSFLERRNPVSLWKALSELILENDQIKNDLVIKLDGRVESTISRSLEEFGLSDFVESNAYVSHDIAIEHLVCSQVLLLPIDDFEGAKWVLTGKLFEYLGARRPILCIGPRDGDAAQVINETHSGYTFEFNDVKGIKNKIVDLYNLYKKNNLNIASSGIDKYSRRGLTKQLTNVLNNLAR